VPAGGVEHSDMQAKRGARKLPAQTWLQRNGSEPVWVCSSSSVGQQVVLGAGISCCSARACCTFCTFSSADMAANQSGSAAAAAAVGQQGVSNVICRQSVVQGYCCWDGHGNARMLHASITYSWQTAADKADACA
jgi:hypothetical protein